MIPFVHEQKISFSQPSADDRRADAERLRDAAGIGPLHIPLQVLKRLPFLMRLNQEATFLMGRDRNDRKIIDISQGVSYSVALDIGTTNIVAVLYDNVQRTAVLEMSTENPQVRFGSDILSRMHHAMSGNAEEVSETLREGVNGFLKALCRKAGIQNKDIHGLVAAGNTVMSHFFLGLDIRNIPADPFVPVVRKPGFLRASELSLDVHPEAPVYVFPNAGSYVGGDIVAGILASGIDLSDEPCILIDVGTNAEVVVGNKDWLLVGAGAAGPALEEGISLIGKKAGKGVIYNLTIQDDIMECETFDGKDPVGICGSGMVSLLAEMHRNGIIDERGVISEKSHWVTTADGERAFNITCSSGSLLTVKQGEINNFLKSKAAMFTLLLVLTRAVGVAFKDIKKVYVSGALGTGIDSRKATAIGMLPAWPPEIIQPIGNSSLAGAGMLLVESELLERIDAIIDLITYKHMHDDPEFMKEFMGAVFIPHTNPELLKV